MPELSPAAQAVLDAYSNRAMRDLHGRWVEAAIAAALRGAADQVVPHREIAPQQDLESRREAMVWGMTNQTQITRHNLLVIAAELEGSND